MAWNGIANDRPLLPSKDTGSKGGKVNFNVKRDSGKTLGLKGSGATRGLADKSDKKALSLGQSNIHNLKDDKKQSFGPAPTGGVTKSKKK